MSGSHLVLAVGLVGCNAVLGIEAPDDTTSSSGTQTVTVMPGESGGSGSGGSTSMSTPVTEGGAPSAPVDPALLAWAQWPMPNPASAGLPNAQSYDTTSFAGVVLDSITGLEWQEQIDAMSYTFTDAATYCGGLTLTGGAWRVPTRIELLSLVDYTNPNPVIDVNAFPDTPSDYFWTSSTFAGDPMNAWHVNFKFGDGITDKSLKTQAHRVRCVR
jgi:hypothetical protein